MSNRHPVTQQITDTAEPEYLTAAEVAAILKVSHEWVYARCEDGTFAYLRAGKGGHGKGGYRIDRAKFDAWREASTVGGAATDTEGTPS